MSGGRAVGESAAAQVVGVGVHDHRASQDVVGSDQRDERVRVREQRHAGVVRLDVAQVAGVSGVVFRAAVFVLQAKSGHLVVEIVFVFFFHMLF